MPIPTASLPHRVTIEAYLGDTAYGPTFAAATAVRARKVGRRRAVRTSDGVDVISSASFVFRPDVTLAAGSRITHGTDTYTVLDVAESIELHRGYALEVLVEGPGGRP